MERNFQVTMLAIKITTNCVVEELHYVLIFGYEKLTNEGTVLHNIYTSELK